MQSPKIPERENERQKELDSYSILDSLTEKEYDSITRIASQICGTPISLITLIDRNRQWFKSSHGLEVKETPRDISFCAHAINDPYNVMLVPNTREDVRFCDNPFVVQEPGVAFYAGVPLVTHNGMALGTLCVIDSEPRNLKDFQVEYLKDLADHVMKLLELRKTNMKLESAMSRLREQNEELERFAYTAAHDIKSPLGNISALVTMIKQDYADALGNEGVEMIDLVGSSARQLNKLVKGLLENSKNSHIQHEERSMVDVNELVTEISGLFSTEIKGGVSLDTELRKISVNRTAIQQIFINLLSNAIKYNDKDSPEIQIGICEEESKYFFYVQDNGPGIAEGDIGEIFELFQTAADKDRYGEKGTGIGLSTVKKLVAAQGGSINVDSIPGKGSRFTFTIDKFPN